MQNNNQTKTVLAGTATELTEEKDPEDATREKVKRVGAIMDFEVVQNNIAASEKMHTVKNGKNVAEAGYGVKERSDEGRAGTESLVFPQSIHCRVVSYFH